MKKCLYVFIGLVLMALTLADVVIADEMTITFASEEWKDATHSDGTGLYWDIFRAVFEPEGYTVKVKKQSYDASVKMVEQKVVDAMVGAYEEEIEDGTYPANHFAVDVVQAVYKNDRLSQWKGLESIMNSTVAWIKGYSYDDYFSEEITTTLKIRRMNDRDAIFRLFDVGKLDFYIDAKADITDFFNTHTDQYQASFFNRQTLLELKLFVVFTKDERGEKLAAIFDRSMEDLLKRGEIRKLYDKYAHATFQYPSDFLKK
ncbi:conserved exported hypothetical protein [Desulfamplus magnetovallimortis]|uniref:Uncharacterized protein n=1 Tax=Desulfamplus magnetovallimortis TaxID=1246637 RepID=A0A1W1HG49_9BACT|nr:transporter substrate-binding domain-containing protein [Desulfamplus magnetovallimortis]SLM31450.1 conserved exported hypothetical protein [Desulfamplus magnetovallimortis]